MPGRTATVTGTKRTVGPFYISIPVQEWLNSFSERTGLSKNEIINRMLLAVKDADENNVLPLMIRNTHFNPIK